MKSSTSCLPAMQPRSSVHLDHPSTYAPGLSAYPRLLHRCRWDRLQLKSAVMFLFLLKEAFNTIFGRVAGDDEVAPCAPYEAGLTGLQNANLT